MKSNVRMLKLTTTSTEVEEFKSVLLVEDYADDRLPKITIHERYFEKLTKASIYLNREQWQAIADVAEAVLAGNGEGQPGTDYAAELG